ncbi:MAG: glycosyltransferase family 2 protein [Chitinophagales bacterium]|nr:glycosyltransferase family 2 protein [Chitinophagales bacterium]MCZ2393893.1 glycosyltransferase family 2 protein [Chitinophagales bacterium]
MSAMVDILLASYNGEKYLDEQLESIFNQDFHDFRVLIRDDGSTDETLNILAKWKGLYPQKIELVEDGKQNLGATQNFNRLMEISTAPYVCFSDQDDKWMPEKVRKQLAFIQSIEEKHPEKGVMIFNDLIICDESMNILSPSLIEKDRLDTRAIKTHRLLIQNVPYGCASFVNRKLLNTAIPIDSRALLHDHWLALVASLTGCLCYLDDVLVYHRIHDNNASRAGSEHKREISNGLMDKLNNQNFQKYLDKQVLQAEAIQEAFTSILTNEQNAMLEDFIRLKLTRGMKRKWIIIKNKFFKNSLLNTIKLILRA